MNGMIVVVLAKGLLYVRHTPEQQVCILNTTYKRQISEDRRVRTFSPALWLSGRSLGILHTW